MILIRPAGKTDIDGIQEVLNHKEVISHLGGFTMRDTLKSKLQQPHRPSLFLAEHNFQVVGAAIVASRAQAHYFKFGEIGVVPEYRRQRIASALYAAMAFQCMLEGRRLGEDTIVGDNPVQFDLLPTIGLNLAGVLKHKTASAKDIGIFQWDLMEPEMKAFEKMVSRLPNDLEIRLLSSFYQDELWSKNMDIIRKKSPDFESVLDGHKETITSLKSVKIIREEPLK